jgi:hypothetical protein
MEMLLTVGLAAANGVYLNYEK